MRIILSQAENFSRVDCDNVSYYSDQNGTKSLLADENPALESWVCGSVNLAKSICTTLFLVELTKQKSWDQHPELSLRFWSP